jgi:subtilisin
MSISLYSETESYVVQTAVQGAHAAGVLMVAAAGNAANPSPSLSFPARYDGVIAVTAMDTSYGLAGFSNWGFGTDLIAPGVGVYSTTTHGRYTNYDGTSQATPHVTGAIALAISSGSLGPVGVDIGLPVDKQGLGLINALSTVVNF